jgi:hypothetical protein
MLLPHPLAWLTRRFGVDRGRALANARPHPERCAQERIEQYQAIRQRREPTKPAASTPRVASDTDRHLSTATRC